MALADSGRALPRGVKEVEPVREFMGDHRRLALTLQQMLEKVRAEQSEMVVKGGPKDFAEYRNRLGVIEGLDIAIAHCKAAQDRL